jgi:3-phenylpropionate/trans-cinnamate dioxygenase ferredoxin reductase component
MDNIVVVGAGQAGASLVAKLRALGHDGGITLVGAEPVPPYQRPPLSKQYLLGEMKRERLYLRPERFYAEHDIALRLGVPATGIERSARLLRLADGGTLPYGRLVLTTGSEPRRLPEAVGGTLAGVHVVRSLADVDAMAPAFRPGRRALVVGGGYIGLEAAAVAAKLGMRVTLVEMADRILGRVAAAETAGFFRELHRSHGVQILEGVGLERIIGDGAVAAARLADGTELGADLVIAGVGVVPATGLAAAAGLDVADGIVVDALGRTSDPEIWAAGDCTCFPHRGGRLRLESVQNAIDQAEAVAANLLGAEMPYRPSPWFWSDQYDVKLQIAGLHAGYDRVVARAGAGAGVSHWYYGSGRLLAVDAMNDPRSYMIGKRLIELGRSPDPALVADLQGDLKALLATPAGAA